MTTWCPSPNFSERRGGLQARYVVLHYTAMDSARAAIDRLCAPEFEVSAHYVIDEHGRVTQLVDEAHRAWHAGRSFWQGCEDMNSASIGIELSNRGTHPFPHPQMQQLRSLLAGITHRWSLPRSHVIGHSDIALGRKTDPGSRFDWRGLARDGFGLWPQEHTAINDPAQFLDHAAQVGYDVAVGVHPVLQGFRLHFAPHRVGALGPDDCADMASLAHQTVVDQTPPSA